MDSTIAQGTELEPAPFWKRFFAYAVDLGIISAAMYALLLGAVFLFFGGAMIGGVLSQMTHPEQGLAIGALIAVALVLIAIIILFHGYFVYFEFKKGQTPGKKLFGLTVISTRADRLTLNQVVMRDFFRYIDCGLLLPGLISMATNKRKQRLGDFAASTRVVHSKSQETAQTHFYMNPDDFESMRGKLMPDPVPEAVQNQFLQIAYPIFILKRPPSHPEDLLPWEELARSFLPGISARPGEGAMDQTTLLLFFAELCFQSHLKRNSNHAASL